MTVLSPEVHAIRWKTVPPDRDTTIELPKDKPGRYFVEIDAQGEPACGGLGYTLTLVPAGTQGSGSGSGAECRAARGQLGDDLDARSTYRKYLRSRDHKTVARYRTILRKVAAALKADRRDVRRYCPKNA